MRNSAELFTPEVLGRMQNKSEIFQGKPYDKYFEWSDERIYCSELVWKIYNESTGLRIGNLQKMKELDFSSPQVQSLMKERYGNQLPEEEKVISPVSMFKSDQLETVFRN